MNSQRMTERVALITGGGTGIGQAIAKLFAQQGAKVVVSGRRTAPLEQTVEEIHHSGGTAAFISGDVTSLENVEAMVNFTVATYGYVDTLVTSAGVIHRDEIIEDATPAQWEWQVNTNLRAVFYAIKCCLPVMIERRKGVIVNIGSVASFKAPKGYATYAATKGALKSYTRVLALQYAEHGIRANIIEPAGVHTPMSYVDRPNYDDGLEQAIQQHYPIRRLGKPEDIAYGALYLASDESSWVTGQSLVIDGGFSLK